MRYLFTAEQSKKLDEHAIHTVGFPGLVLMEKAAMTLVSVIMEREEKSKGILFLCGTGNNGGDGLAAARMLHQQGYRTAVALIGDPQKLSPDAAKQLELVAACDVPVVKEEAVFSPLYEVLADGLFGVGLSRDIGGVYEKVISDMNNSGKKVYAIDIPSGIHGDNGRVMNVAVRADVTVTFGVNKLGLVLYPGCSYAGDVIVADIGYPGGSYQSVSNPAYYYEPQDLPQILPERNPEGHKGTFGHVGIVGGSATMCGAVLLAARAAYASGAGLVRVVSSFNNREIVLSGCPEILFDSYETEEGGIDFEALDELNDFADVVILGPGLGRGKKAEDIVHYMLEHCRRPVVLDGDGITLCRKEDLMGGKSRILTPHPKEFSEISGMEIAFLKEKFLEQVEKFSRDTGCVMVGKDARTIVSDGTSVYVNVSGNSGMGTGGSGDVLTGVIAAFCAQGVPLFEAAKAGVYVHGLAGDYFVEKFNEYSLTASDLVDSLKFILGKGLK